MFYQHVGPLIASVPGLHVPALLHVDERDYHAFQPADAPDTPAHPLRQSEYMFVMERVSDATHTQHSPLSQAEAYQSLELLARLHAWGWQGEWLGSIYCSDFLPLPITSYCSVRVSCSCVDAPNALRDTNFHRLPLPPAFYNPSASLLPNRLRPLLPNGSRSKDEAKLGLVGNVLHKRATYWELSRRGGDGGQIKQMPEVVAEFIRAFEPVDLNGTLQQPVSRRIDIVTFQYPSDFNVPTPQRPPHTPQPPNEDLVFPTPPTSQRLTVTTTPQGVAQIGERMVRICPWLSEEINSHHASKHQTIVHGEAPSKP